MNVAHLLLITLYFIVKVESKCDSFENIKIKIAKKEAKNLFEKEVNGCIERRKFDGETLTEIYVNKQNIRILKTDAIKHLAHLAHVSFEECPIEKVEPQCFRNVPRLTYLEFVMSNIRELPTGISNELSALEELKINNKLEIIQEGAIANLPYLRNLDLSNNMLKHWNRLWFANVTSLLRINMTNNRIKKIPKNAFIIFPSLRYICMDSNQITSITPEAFRGLTKLDYLSLRYNLIQQLEQNTFPSPITIDTLNIAANRLNFIPQEVFNNVKVNNLIADGNPWLCPCWDLILSWIHNDGGVLNKSDRCKESLPVCVFSDRTQECIEHVDANATKVFYDNIKEIQNNTTDFISIVNTANCIRLN